MTENETIERIRSLLKNAKDLDDRCTSLISRAEALHQIPIKVADSDTSTLQRLSNQVKELGPILIAPLHFLSEREDFSIIGAHDHIASITEMANGFHERLDELFAHPIRDIQPQLEAALTNLITSYHSRLTELKQKLLDSVEDHGRHLQDEFDVASGAIGSVLSGLGTSISETERLCEEILDVLRQLRDAVLAACRDVSIGAEAATHSVSTLINAFSGVG
jgi:hypothetical protein